MRNLYAAGRDLLGASAAERKGVVIKIKDVGALVAAQKKGVGAAAFAILPETVTDAVYAEVVKGIKDAMKEKNVDAIVEVRDVSGLPAAATSNILRDVALVLGTLAAGITIGKFVLGGRRR